MRVKTRIIQKVFVFLLLTVGILYIALWLNRRVREPFQATDPIAVRQERLCDEAKSESNCEEQTIGDDKVWICRDGGSSDSKTLADTIIRQCTNPPEIVLSADASLGPSLVGDNDTSCYSVPNSMTGSNFYVCYQRPPVKYYDEMAGGYTYTTVDNDQVPYQLADELPAVCGAYTSLVGTVVRTLSTTKGDYSRVNNIVNTMSNAYIAMSNLSTTKCDSTKPRGADLLNSCRELGTFLSNYTFSSANSNVGRLLNIQTAYSNATSNLISTFNNQIDPQFKGFGCAFPNIPKPAEFK